MTAPPPSSPRGSGEPERYRLVIPTDISRLGETVETVAAICFARIPGSARTHFRLCTVVAEAVTNAMVYGNLGDPGRRVTIEIELDAERTVIAVTDEGEGFDPATIPEPTCEGSLEATRGRGIFIIRRFADAVEFNARGNTICMTLPRR